MAVYDLEEQERIDALKDWWSQNGKYVYAAIGTLAAVYFGVNGWNWYKRDQNVKAEALFKDVQKLSPDKDAKKLGEVATDLAAKFPDTFYATEAALLAAKASFEAKDYPAARAQLAWAADKGIAKLRPVARLRLAAVWLEEKNYDEALKAIDAVKDESFVALASDLKGDVLMAQGKKDDARTAYGLAVDKADARSPLKQFTQFKLDALGEAK